MLLLRLLDDVPRDREELLRLELACDRDEPLREDEDRADDEPVRDREVPLLLLLRVRDEVDREADDRVLADWLARLARLVFERLDGWLDDRFLLLVVPEVLLRFVRDERELIGGVVRLDPERLAVAGGVDARRVDEFNRLLFDARFRLVDDLFEVVELEGVVRVREVLLRFVRDERELIGGVVRLDPERLEVAGGGVDARRVDEFNRLLFDARF